MIDEYPPIDPEAVKTAFQASVMLRIEPASLWQAIKANELPTTPGDTPSGSPMVRVKDVQAWVERQGKE